MGANGCSLHRFDEKEFTARLAISQAWALTVSQDLDPESNQIEDASHCRIYYIKYSTLRDEFYRKKTISF